MKALVKPVSSEMFIVPTTGETIEPNRPSVVTLTEFVSTLGMRGKIKAFGGPLPDTATDAEFLKFFNESDRDQDLAIDSFMSKMEKDMQEQREKEGDNSSVFDRLIGTIKMDNDGQVTGYKAHEVKPADTVTETSAPKADEKPADTVTETSAPKADEKPAAEAKQKPDAAVTSTAAPKPGAK